MVSLHLCICLDIWYQQSTVYTRSKLQFISYWCNLSPTFMKQLNSIKYSSINIYIFYCKHFFDKQYAYCYYLQLWQILGSWRGWMQVAIKWDVVSCFSLWFVLQCSHHLILHAADGGIGELGRNGSTCGLNEVLSWYMPGKPEKIHKQSHSNSQYPAKTPRIHILIENESCNILRAVLMNIWVFWDVTSCQLVNSNWHLTGTCYFQKHRYLSAIQRGTSYKT